MLNKKSVITFIIALIFMSSFSLFLPANTIKADHCGPDTNENVPCSEAATSFKCDTGEFSGCPPCDNCTPPAQAIPMELSGGLPSSASGSK